jgi:hypothetical protein
MLLNSGRSKDVAKMNQSLPTTTGMIYPATAKQLPSRVKLL